MHNRTRYNRLLDSLPDDVLSKILTMLPTQDRAKAETVCKTWRQVSKDNWTSVSMHPLTPKEIRASTAWLASLENPSLLQSIIFSPLGHIDLQVFTRFRNLSRLELTTNGYYGMIVSASDALNLMSLTNLETLSILYKPYDDDDGADVEGRDKIVTLQNFVQLQKLSQLIVTFIDLPGALEPTWRLDLSADFEERLTELKSLQLHRMYEMIPNASLKRLVGRLQDLQINQLLIPLEQVFHAPHLTAFRMKLCKEREQGFRERFPFLTANQLENLAWQGPKLRLLTPEDNILGRLKRFVVDNLVVSSAELQNLPLTVALTELRFCHEYFPKEPYTLYQLSRFTGLEKLELRMPRQPHQFAVEGILGRLQSLTMIETEDCSSTYSLGNGVQHLQALKQLCATLVRVKGTLESDSLEVLELTYIEYSPFPGPAIPLQVLGYLPRLHTLKLRSCFQSPLEVLVVAQSLGGLPNLKDLVLVRENRKHPPNGWPPLIATILTALRNSRVMYDRIVIDDQGADVEFRRSFMPSTKHLEIECRTFELFPTCPGGDDLLYPAQSFCLRLQSIGNERTSRTWSKLMECRGYRLERSQRSKRYKPASFHDATELEIDYAYDTGGYYSLLDVYDCVGAFHRVGELHVPPEFLNETWAWVGYPQ